MMFVWCSLAPEFVKRLSGEEAVDEGADLTLQFKVVGIPPPTLRWFKDDEEVSDHPRLSVDKKEDGSHLLTLHAVNKGDEAAYRCRAENSEGSSSCCFFLSVKGGQTRLSFQTLPFPPTASAHGAVRGQFSFIKNTITVVRQKCFLESLQHKSNSNWLCLRLIKQRHGHGKMIRRRGKNEIKRWKIKPE